LTFVVQQGHTGQLDAYLTHGAPDLRSRFTVIDYPSVMPLPPQPWRRPRWLQIRRRRVTNRARFLRLSRLPRAPRGRIHIFCDIDRLTPSEREQAGKLRKALMRDRRCRRVLNDPARSLCRYELLRRLHDRGQNAFDLCRLSELRGWDRFPVFLRGEDDHDGPLTPLLHSREELDAALEKLAARGRVREGKLLVEYLDTRDDDGWYRKYGAFRIGDRIVPRHVFLSKHWMVKEREMTGDLSTEKRRAEELHYLETSPHEAQLQEIFDLAHIEYGRIDYAMHDGKVQTWEINTNPVILLERHLEPGPRRETHERFAELYRDAIEVLCAG